MIWAVGIPLRVSPAWAWSYERPANANVGVTPGAALLLLVTDLTGNFEGAVRVTVPLENKIIG